MPEVSFIPADGTFGWLDEGKAGVRLSADEPFEYKTLPFVVQYKYTKVENLQRRLYDPKYTVVNCSYTGLGYTGICTHRTKNFSPTETAHSIFCTVRLFAYTGFLKYRTLNLSPNPSPV